MKKCKNVTYGGACHIPGPVTIDDSDACMGKAMRMFRGSWISKGITDRDDFDYAKADEIFGQVKPEYYSDRIDTGELYEIYIMWVALDASLAQILTIVVMAAEA